MALGDYTPTTYATGDVITATKLNNNETKTEELDTELTTHVAQNAIDAHGVMPAAKVTHNVAQSIPNATYTTIAFNTERYDTDTIHDNVTNNSRLTCKTAGKYLITANLSFAANATGFREISIALNTTSGIATTNTLSVGAATNTIIQATAVYSLAVNDFVEVQAYQNSGGALNIQPSSNYSPDFSMVKVG